MPCGSTASILYGVYRGELLQVDPGFEVPGVPGVGDARTAAGSPACSALRHVDSQLIGDDMGRHHRRGGEQLQVVDDRAVGEIADPSLLLAGLTVDAGDVQIARLAGGVEARKPAGLRRPGQHHVVTGDRLAVGVHRVVGDLVVQHQRLPADHRHGAEVVVGEHLTVRAVEGEAGQHPGEGLRAAGGRPCDGVGVVGGQRAVDGVVDLIGGVARAGHQRAGRDDGAGRRQRPGQAPVPESHAALPPAGGVLARWFAGA